MDIRETYLAASNETDRESSDTLLASTWDSTAKYVDPLAAVEHVVAISEVIAAVHGTYPGFVFSPVGDVDSHRDVARFQWGLGLLDEESAAVGSDVVTLTKDGRIAAVAGFIDKMPA